MPEQSFPKHPKLHLDGDNRLCLTLDNGTVVPLTKGIVFTNTGWAREAFERLSRLRLLQSSLASTLLCVRKLLHAKSKKSALNDADQQMLTVALTNLRNSRGNETENAIGSGTHYGMSFIDAIDKTFKEAATAVSATTEEH